MKPRLLLTLIPIVFFTLSAGRSQEPSADSSLTAHEWGSFTSIAGAKGEAVVWSPQADRDDLPSFVEHLQNNRFKGGLQGTVRMETPILYFHASNPVTVSVHVGFAQGFLTEWYPHALGTMPADQLTAVRPDSNSPNGELLWQSVAVTPGASEDFPKETAASRYYAARETDASPVAVGSSGHQQHEKFLFYRGVANFAPPISAIPQNGGRIYVSNLNQAPIPQAILFERRGERLGYRILGPIQNASIVESPELNADGSSIRRDLERILVDQGLFPDEAHSMLKTWNDSWFEEGARLLYIVPRAFVDKVLPLTIKPAPAATTRVFVGRMEIVTPATENAIETAFRHDDRDILAKYHRFLSPILQTMIARSHSASHTRQLNQYLNATYIDMFKTLSAKN
ncbi:MAG TPA: hypothetical protein VFP96_13125 [Candidatus Acidoferrum sp.]|nr:hypothetical protein [Candidatus Acidoferrum sp.]